MIIANSSNSPIGLDISDLSLKMIQLKRAGDKISVQGLAKVDLGQGVIDDGIIKDKPKIINEINKMIEKPDFGSFNTRDIVSCLPESHSFIKLIEIEKTPNKLEDILVQEIEKHFPLSIKEIYYDWQVIGETGEYHSVLIGAATKNVVDDYIDALGQAKLCVLALENESLSLCRALLKEESKKFSGEYSHNYAIIDIGAVSTNMIIYAKNTIVLSMSMPISSDEVTRTIAKTLDIKKDEAEKAKIICGLDKSQAHGIINDILAKMINDLLDKSRTSLNYYSKNYGKYGPINQIILSGGGSNIKDLDKILSENLKITAIKADPLFNLNNKSAEQSFVKLTGKKSGDILNDDLVMGFSTAIGLGLRNIFINSI